MFNKQILVYALMMYIMQYTVTDLLIMHKDVSHEMHYSIIKDTPNGWFISLSQGVLTY